MPLETIWIPALSAAAAALLGWLLGRRRTRSVTRTRRVERPGMRFDQARVGQLEGELAIAQREIERQKARLFRVGEAEKAQLEAARALHAKITERDARIADLEAELASVRIAPGRKPVKASRARRATAAS